MPTLQILSIYKERKRMFAAELRQAHSELEQFRAGLTMRFGEVVANTIRQEIWWRDCGIVGGTSELSEDALDAVETILSLKRRVRSVCRQIHTPGCRFHEWPGGISVWESLGMSWDDVWRMVGEDRRLAIPAVLRLLNVVRTTEQVMPTEERLGKWANFDGAETWWRLFRGRHRRLLHLLQTAAEREEDLAWHSPP